MGKACYKHRDREDKYTRHIHLAVPFESRPGSDLRAASIGFDDYLRVWGDRSLKRHCDPPVGAVSHRLFEGRPYGWGEQRRQFRDVVEFRRSRERSCSIAAWRSGEITEWVRLRYFSTMSESLSRWSPVPRGWVTVACADVAAFERKTDSGSELLVCREFVVGLFVVGLGAVDQIATRRRG